MPRGIVLTNGSPTAGTVYHMVLVFEHAYRTVRDFKLLPVDSHRTKTKLVPAMTLSGVKEVERFVEETLIYGDTLSWENLDMEGRPVEFIQDYNRVQPVCESRIFNGETQLLLHGIMSKNRAVLWMCDIWPDLEIPYHLRQDTHPNVTVHAWVTVQLLENQALKYELHSFHEAADAFQHLVKKAKWNIGEEGNLQTLYDPMSGKGPSSDSVTPMSDTLTGIHGVVISKKIVLDRDHPNICFHRVVIRDGDRFPSIGTVKSTIRKVDDLPGYFYSKLLNIYVDDPENILESWLLSPYSGSTLQVGITATEPSAKGNPRFVVAEIVDQKLEKIEKFRREGNAKLVNEPAVVIDEMGKIHVARLPKSNLRIPSDQVAFFPPGTKIRLTASLGPRRWKVEEVRVDQKEPTIRTVAVTIKNKREVTDIEEDDEEEMKPQIQYWFYVPATRGCKELPFLLQSTEFGLLQTPQIFKMRQNPHYFRFSNIWLTLNDCHPGEMMKPPAKFKFIYIGEDVNIPCKSVPAVVVHSTTPDYPDLSSDLEDDSIRTEDETLRREYAANEANVPAVFPAMRDDEFQRKLNETDGTDVAQMIRALERNPEWKTNPHKYINQQVSAHLSKCASCSVNEFSDTCHFTEYLSHALRNNPTISHFLNKNILSMVATRRYRE
ncbi:hypothetical protein CRE_02447 [Caenorhabditis remanei]|uniref:Uncharacterized protein n=1 Tax=Caenorhabditis remanei TaxID=31234 RepID=E3MIT7_CAERE|nr:hypothetical protein CRE_02447 [Caenorhabditis remanei]